MIYVDRSKYCSQFRFDSSLKVFLLVYKKMQCTGNISLYDKRRIVSRSISPIINTFHLLNEYFIVILLSLLFEIVLYRSCIWVFSVVCHCMYGFTDVIIFYNNLTTFIPILRQKNWITHHFPWDKRYLMYLSLNNIVTKTW